MADAPILSAGAGAASKAKLDEAAFGAASPGRSCTRACAPSRPPAAAAPPRRKRAAWSPAAAPSPGARRAPAAPAPAPTARRSGRAVASCSARSRAPTPSRSTARSSAPRCAARCRCTPERGSLAVLDAGCLHGAQDQPGLRPARRLGPAAARRSSCSAPRSQPPRCRSATSPAWPCSRPSDVGVTDLVGAASLLRLRAGARAAHRAHRRSRARARRERGPDGAHPGDHPPGRLREELRALGRRPLHLPRPPRRPQDRRSARRSRRCSTCTSSRSAR